MRTWGRAGIAALALLACGPAAHAAGALPLLSHHGRWLTDPQGRVVILHGLQIDRWAANRRVNIVDLDPANIDLMADNGFNAARMNVTWSGYESVINAPDEPYLDPFVALDAALAGHGIYDLVTSMQGQYAESLNGWGFPEWTVFTDGAPNGNQPFGQGYVANPAQERAWDNFWANVQASDGRGIQDHYADWLGRLATRFADKPGVLGIDVLNEPWPGSMYGSCSSPTGCPPQGFDQTALTAFSQKAIQAVRAKDPKHLVFYEPNLLFDYGSQTGLGKMDDPNVVFAYHVYCLAYAALGTGDPGNNCGTGEVLSMDNAEAYAKQTGAGLLLDEVGNNADHAVNDRLAAEADAHMVGTSFWALEDCCNSAAAVVADGSKPPTAPGNLRTDVLDALVRAYPRTIAGTPTSWSYDPDKQTFALDYAPALVGGGSAAGMQTEVFVPALHFDHGYRTQVTGAAIVSPAGSGLLRLCNLPGATAVSVRVTPADAGTTDLPTATSGADPGCARSENTTSGSPGTTVTTGPTTGGSEKVTGKGTGTVRLPSSRHCLRRHRLIVHFTIPRGARLRTARVTIAGRRVATRRRGHTVIARSDLHWVHGARFRVRAVLRVRSHGRTRRLELRRSYRFCRAS